MEADNICARQLEAQKVVDYELVKRLQQERRTAQRHSVQPFTLLVAYRFFDNLNTELRPG